MTAVDQGFDPATIDLLDGAWYTGDPHAAWRWMRSNAPVFHDERNDVYAVTRYDDVTRVERDPTTFSSHPGIRPHTGHSPIMIHLDPPDHVKRRKLVNRGFTPRAVRALEAKLHVLVDTLIDDVIERGECDFVGELASWLPLIVIADLLGFDPADRAATTRPAMRAIRRISITTPTSAVCSRSVAPRGCGPTICSTSCCTPGSKEPTDPARASTTT
jgi:cytochrome P450 family 142 subfamily A polypeptide 1